MSLDQSRQSPVVGASPLVRNTLYNLTTQVFLVIVALVSLPVIVRGLSKESFGLLSLLWVFMGYFGFLDLGLGSANTKLVSESLARNDYQKASQVIRTSFMVSVVFGVIVSSVLFALAPTIIEQIFQMSDDLIPEAVSALKTASFAIPFVLVYAVSRGVQVGLQRFDVMNIVQATVGVLQWAGTIVCVVLGMGVTSVIAVILILRMAAAVVSTGIVWKLVPGLWAEKVVIHKETLKTLISFGGWVSVSQTLSPMFLYLDRVMIGALVSLVAVAHYTVPQEMLTRLLILPISLATALFPMLSVQGGTDEAAGRTASVYSRSLKLLGSLMVPVCVVMIAFAHPVLEIWAGKNFASEGVGVFQILAVGLLFNALAQIPAIALQASGRPDVNAKFHVIEFPVAVALNLWLIPRFGIQGAALTWTIRVALDALLLFAAARRYAHPEPSLKMNPKLVLTSLPIILTSFLPDLLENKVLQAGSFLVFLSLYAWGVWVYGLDDTDRQAVFSLRVRIFETGRT